MLVCRPVQIEYRVAMSPKLKRLLHLLPLALLVIAIVLAFYFRLDRYLSFDTLKEHREQLQMWTQAHYFKVVLVFMAIYVVSVAFSLPGAVFLTLAGGFLFGNIWGSVYVVISATIGATLLFLIVKFALADWFSKKSESWVSKMQKGFQKNAFQYLLFLRFIPAFPFWAVNIVPAILNIRTSTFVFGTFIGIIPGSVVYVTIGNGLNHIFAAGQTPNLGIIFEPQVLLPLIALAVLSLIPVVIKKLRKPKNV